MATLAPVKSKQLRRPAKAASVGFPVSISNPIDAIDGIGRDGLSRPILPCFDDMLWALFYYLPRNHRPETILDLGCGIGVLTEAMAKRWPDAEITAIDRQGQMLATTSDRVGRANLRLLHDDFMMMDWPKSYYDVVMTRLTLHHLDDADKQRDV